MKKHPKAVRHDRTAGSVFVQTGRGRALDISGQLDVPRCPICQGPMAARLSRRGPYFHCRCHERN